MNYIQLKKDVITPSLFRHFIRRQQVTQCLRKRGNRWIPVDAPFVDDWSEQEYQYLVCCLHHTLDAGGLVLGAFEGTALKGFASVEGTLKGPEQEYLDLTSLHVSQDRRGRGVGKTLFSLAAQWAKQHGAQKLYISSHSAVETQAFYQRMGCIDAAAPDPEHVQAEPYDRQLEYQL